MMYTHRRLVILHQRKGPLIGEVDDNSVDKKVKEVRYQQEQPNKPVKDRQ